MPRVPFRRRSLFRLVVALLGLYLLFTACIAFYQRSFLYPNLMPSILDPADAGMQGYRRATLENGAQPILYWEAEAREQKPLLFYFHGNGGGLSTFKPALTYLRQQGFHVIALEYRGYPGAGGTANQTGIEQDALTIYDTFHRRYPRRPIVLWGYSLGTGVATHVAAVRDVSAIILEAPYTSVLDRAEEIMPFLPVRWLLRDTYLSRDAVTCIHAPLMILHGEADTIIPVAHGKTLYALANAPKKLKLYPNASHLDLIAHGAYDDAVTFIHAYVH